MTNLKVRNISNSDLILFSIKGAPCEELETCFFYQGVSYTREPTVCSYEKMHFSKLN